MTFNKNVVRCRTRQFIDEELILAIRNFSENLPILKSPILTNTQTSLYSPAQDKGSQEERRGRLESLAM